MSIQCINIKKHEPTKYEWAVVVGNEAVYGNSVAESITDCLTEATGPMLLDTTLVEIKYRGIHMGTFRADDVFHHTGDVTTRICAMFAELAPNE